MKSKIYPVPEQVIFSFSKEQPAYSEINDLPNVHFVKGLEFNIPIAKRTLIIIDDQMADVMKSESMQELFTKGIHHESISCILLNQNLYPQGKHGRDIRLNNHYYVIMKSPTLVSQVTFLGRQIFPTKKNFVLEAYKKATEQPYSYLFLNLHPYCDDRLRVRTGILEGETEYIFVPK